MHTSIRGLFKELWKQRRADNLKEIEDVGERTKPTEIFGTFRNSNKRSFKGKQGIVLGIRPFESWEREINMCNNNKLTWLEGKGTDEIGVLFELEDKSRIMGIVTRSVYRQNFQEIHVGACYAIDGVFEFIKIIEDFGVYMCFRIQNLNLLDK